MTHASAMTSRARVQAAIGGEAVDRPPISIWRHFPEQDQTAADLTEATLAWQATFGFDLVKFMPPGDYPIIDWGAESRFEGSPGGTRTTIHVPINHPTDLATLRPVDVRQGFNGVILDALSRTRAGLAPDVPLFHTVFSPLTIAMKLSHNLAVEHLRDHPAEVHAALTTITEVTRAMVAAALEAGADGLFFASQCADFRVSDEAEYREFGLHYDLEVLAAAQPETIVLLHLHGEAPMFDLQNRYPAQILNWHDRHAPPDLAEGKRRSGRCIAGGLNERTIATISPEAAATETRDAIARTGGRGLIVAPGCVVPVATPEATIRAVIAAVGGA